MSDTIEAINARLVEIEQATYLAPGKVREARDAAAAAEETYQRAYRHALLVAPIVVDGRKLTTAEREAHAFLATEDERAAAMVAESAHQYTRDKVRALERETNSLQTRSANLRAEAGLAGRGT